METRSSDTSETAQWRFLGSHLTLKMDSLSLRNRRGPHQRDSQERKGMSSTWGPQKEIDRGQLRFRKPCKNSFWKVKLITCQVAYGQNSKLFPRSHIMGPNPQTFGFLLNQGLNFLKDTFVGHLFVEKQHWRRLAVRPRLNPLARMVQ